VSKPLLELRGVKMWFPIRGGFWGKTRSHTRAVDGVDLGIWRGETLGLVGESGCGKSTLGRMVVRLLDPTEGEVLYEDINLEDIGKHEWRKLRPQIQMVFQDTQSSLDPRMTVENIVAEPLRENKMASGPELYEQVEQWIERVGLNMTYLNRFPHELSGGERQRIVTARALATKPRLVVLDEPTASLDVSVQATILNLLRHLQRQFQLTYLFISHDLNVVRFMSTEVAVMYLAKVVERASSDTIFKNPLHPYSRALLTAIPIPDPTLKRERLILKGDVPSADAPPPGCRFHPRCPWVEDVCRNREPALIPSEADHMVACHFAYKFQHQPVFTAEEISAGKGRSDEGTH